MERAVAWIWSSCLDLEQLLGSGSSAVQHECAEWHLRTEKMDFISHILICGCADTATDLEQGGAVAHDVVKQAVQGRAARLDAAQESSVREHQPLQEGDVMVPWLVADVQGPA